MSRATGSQPRCSSAGLLGGRRLSEAAAVSSATRRPKGTSGGRAATSRADPRRVARMNDELGESGRVLVRPSGTEPLFRCLQRPKIGGCREVCASIAALVEKELG